MQIDIALTQINIKKVGPLCINCQEIIKTQLDRFLIIALIWLSIFSSSLFLGTVLCSLSFEDRILEERTGIRRAPDRLEEDRAPLDKGRCEAAWEADWDIDIPGASSLTIFPEIFEVETSGYHDNIDICAILTGFQ